MAGSASAFVKRVAKTTRQLTTLDESYDRYCALVEDRNLNPTTKKFLRLYFKLKFKLRIVVPLFPSKSVVAGELRCTREELNAAIGQVEQFGIGKVHFDKPPRKNRFHLNFEPDYQRWSAPLLIAPELVDVFWNAILRENEPEDAQIEMPLIQGQESHVLTGEELENLQRCMEQTLSVQPTPTDSLSDEPTPTEQKCGRGVSVHPTPEEKSRIAALAAQTRDAIEHPEKYEDSRESPERVSVDPTLQRRPIDLQKRDDQEMIPLVSSDSGKISRERLRAEIKKLLHPSEQKFFAIWESRIQGRDFPLVGRAFDTAFQKLATGKIQHLGREMNDVFNKLKIEAKQQERSQKGNPRLEGVFRTEVNDYVSAAKRKGAAN